MSSSYDTIYKKLASTMEQGSNGSLPEKKIDPTRHISPVVAHELNNIITIIMGYGERLVLKSAGNPEMEAHLKLIVEASRRAATLVRDATPVNGSRLMPSGANGHPKESQPATS